MTSWKVPTLALGASSFPKLNWLKFSINLLKMSRALRIGRSVVREEARWKAIQLKLGLHVDGWPGNQFLGKVEELLGMQATVPEKKDEDLVNNASLSPKPDYASMVDAYGVPGDESKLVRIKFPFPMRLYSRDSEAKVLSHRVHKDAHDSLLAILSEILDTFGQEWITEHGIDVFGGIYNNRNSRGGISKSKHAWGVAIDINPAENRNRQRWAQGKIGQSGWANMPIEVIEIFEKHGWKSGGRAWGRDAMHFQRTR